MSWQDRAMSDSNRREVRTLERWTEWDSGWLRIESERVELPDGRRAELQIVRHPGAAAIVPVTDAGEVLLLRQYRHPTGGWLLEVPAGKLDEGESPETCAARELEEETGYRPSELVELGPIWTSPGFTDEKIWLFLARGLEPGQQALEDDEVLEVERLSIPRALEMAEKGEIEDGKSVSALLRAARHLA
jgi:ADP-ribose pyrophosphatase